MALSMVNGSQTCNFISGDAIVNAFPSICVGGIDLVFSSSCENGVLCGRLLSRRSVVA